MKKNIKSIISIITIFSLVGCTTITTRTTGIFDSRSIEKQNVIIDNFKAIKSRGTLFVQGRLINKSSSELTSIELEARGYDEKDQLVSTDRIKLVPNRLKNNEKVSFNMTFTKNVDQIDSYYFVGKYDSIKTEIRADWDTLGVVLLTAGVVAAIATAAYYGQGPGGHGYPSSTTYRTDDRYSSRYNIETMPKVSVGSITGRFNPGNPLSEYSILTGKYNPNNPLSEFANPLGSMNPNNPFSEIASPLGKYNPRNPLSEVSSPTGSLNPSNPLSEVSTPTGRFNPNNPLAEGIHPYYYYKRYLENAKK